MNEISVAAYLETVNGALKNCVARVRGEVIACKVWNSGHVYFTLKDQEENAVLSCVIWRGRYAFFGLALEDGMEIVIEGHPEVYAPTGRLSFIVETAELVGEGALMKRYVALKKKLQEEGLFAEERKRTLPLFPQRVGVITSVHGAVIHDFANNLGAFGFSVEICHSAVEGMQSAKELVGALRTFQKKEIDVLVVMRGGGSMESLAGFDNETLAREIAQFPVPVIAAIGHHQDVPLAALAADFAVSTPTAAAHELSRSWEQARYELGEAAQTIMHGYRQSLVESEHSFSRLAHAIERMMSYLVQRFSEYIFVIKTAVAKIRQRIMLSQSLLVEKTHHILQSFKYAQEQTGLLLQHSEQVVALNDPKRQLRLGYSIVKKGNKIVRSIRDAVVGDDIHVVVADGDLDAKISHIHKN